MPPAAAARKIEEPKKLIPVLNNRLGKIQISAGRGVDGAFDGSKMIDLDPGANLIDEERWAEARKQSAVKKLFKELIKGTGAPEDRLARIGKPVLVEGNPLRADNPLLDLDADEQLKFVENTESLELLKQLAAQEAEGQTLIAINAKIKKIESPKNKPLRRGDE